MMHGKCDDLLLPMFLDQQENVCELHTSFSYFCHELYMGSSIVSYTNFDQDKLIIVVILVILIVFFRN